MRYFLTGGTGFIGRHLARQLRAEDHEVVALVRDLTRAGDLASLGIELVAGDVVDPETLGAPMAGVDGVFHVAGWYRVGARDTSAAERVNVAGTRNVLEAARAAGVPKVVSTSPIAVFGHTAGQVVDEDYRHDGPWISEYDRTKWAAHYQVAVPMAEAGLPLVIVQPGLVYGPNDESQVGVVLRDYLRRRLPARPAQAGCWSHVEDVAAGHILAMERGRVGESYVLGGECAPWTQVLELARDITGIRPPRLTLPPFLARLSSILLRPVAAVLPLPATYHPETLRVAAGTVYWASDAKARRELGWNPRPLREGLAETLRAEQAAMA
jgi:dihydroflavonol-4-reductase